MDLRCSVAAFLVPWTLSACTTDPQDFEPEPGCRSDADCELQPNTPVCLQFEAEGPSVCASRQVPVTECNAGNPRDECCSNDDCDGARCFLVVTQPVQCSATAGFDAWNDCVADDCESDADCPAGLCTPDGLGEGRACVPAACRTDADCSEKEDGVCTLLDLGCCEEVIGGAPTRTPQIACVYPRYGCQSDADCPESEYCVVRQGRATCDSSCP